MDKSLLYDVPRNVNDRVWLKENIQELYDICRSVLKRGEALEDVIAVMLAVLPKVLDFDEAKRWGKLMEQVYLHTPYAQYNGIDGVNTTDVADIYVFMKRPKIPQLPTKTKRNKRVIVHPTQMLEIYWILFLAYVKPQDVTRQQIHDILYFARVVGNTYLNNKTNTTLAFIHIQRNEPELAINHAEITLSYWKSERMMLEAGLNAYVYAIALQQLKQQAESLYWMTEAANYLANTTYKSSYFTVELSAAALRLQLADSQADIKQAQERANLTLNMLSKQGDKTQARQALHHVQPLIDDGSSRLTDFTHRLQLLADE